MLQLRCPRGFALAVSSTVPCRGGRIPKCPRGPRRMHETSRVAGAGDAAGCRGGGGRRPGPRSQGECRRPDRARPYGAREHADLRRTQRSSVGNPNVEDGAAGRGRLRSRRAGSRPHQPRPPEGGRGRSAVLVRVHPGRVCRQRLCPTAARADRHRSPDDRAVSGAGPDGHGGGGRGGDGGRPHRVDAGCRGRSRDRELPRSAARLLRPGRALHDAHAQRDPRLGGRRAGYRSARRA